MRRRPAMWLVMVCCAGCASPLPPRQRAAAVSLSAAPAGVAAERTGAAAGDPATITRASFEPDVLPDTAPNSTLDPVPPPEPDEPAPGPQSTTILRLEEVISSVYAAYPLLEAAFHGRTIAEGEQLAAAGNFDLKLKAASENGPTGFYQTYRQLVGLEQPTYWGGEVFAGYRLGRGDYQPWYLERETNDGGEFKAGVSVPLARDRNIDARRAELWRSTYGRQFVEPDIQAQLIGFVQEAGYAYWDWVAAGAEYGIYLRILSLAEDRTGRIAEQVQAGLIDPPELTDNQRLVAERRAKLAEASRKLQQKAIKLSLYYRDFAGEPIIPAPELLPDFPEPAAFDAARLDLDSRVALQSRPELKALDLLLRQLEVDYAQAHNEMRPAVNGLLWGSQDVGAPTSSKRDKSQFELEASLIAEMPLQFRKARGKALAVQGKIAQLSAKRRLTEDKIVADVQDAYSALVAAYEQVVQTREAVRLAEEMAERERQNFEAGASDLLKVTLREQYAAESALKKFDSLRQYYEARADYRAALAQDRVAAP